MLALQKVARGIGFVELREVPEPEPGPGQVVLEVAYAGICGTDIHIYDDEFITEPPVTMGHEVSGIVAKVGPGVTRAKPGDQVVTETYFSICGECIHCRAGLPNLCTRRKSIGSRVNGGFARYVLVPELNLHLLPDGVSLKAAALVEPLGCCINGVNLAGVRAGEVAVVSGPGTIGLLTMQLCKASGAYTVVLGTSADAARLQKARELGADLALDVQAEGDRLDAIMADLTGGYGADVVFECAGAAPSVAQCLRLVRRKGRYGQVGLAGKPVTFDLDQVCYKELVVTGSNATVPWVWERALELAARGQVQMEPLVSDVFPLSRWEEAFQRFRSRQGFKIMLTPEG